MKKRKKRYGFRAKKAVENDAVPIPPWFYNGCDVIILNDEDWWEPPPAEEPIPA